MNLPRPPHIPPDQWERAHRYTGALIRTQQQTAPWWVDPEDCASEAWLMLWQASLTYEARPGRTFHVYAHRRVRGRLLDLVRQAAPVSRYTYGRDAPPVRPLSWEEIPEAPVAPAAEPDPVWAEIEATVARLGLPFAWMLSPQQEEVIRGRLLGESFPALAARLRLKVAAVEKHYKTGLRVLAREAGR